ncbi:MAG: OmpH family outer membrane protein [Chitinophagaceae bacterium]|nr:OmpH family outer membrane protein [Chitinophagaceae bacterium]MCA6451793.1 OmpH family outer membrane protein [Chitinophagaceae bacterium]MCA6457441.1 OmpH family outer membrane protein [Chitinophagaceae bacterium]MCA6459711.1 OmpH family outer membrane protein [Chitinophagaceae bacterium]MCA6466244.1 OmpH family outer membrane protein [Chitinophagaceae bacterium]
MKNLNLGLNIVLVVAVAVLFYLQFSSPAVDRVSTVGTKAVPAGSFKIAYFETDSIQNQFEYFKEVSSELQAKDQANARILGDMKNTFAAKYQELQKVAASLSQAELASKQQELMQMEKTFQGKEKMMSDEMQDEQFRKMQDVKKKIEDYLKEYNKDKGYAFILSSSPDLMYLKDTVYNITPDVIRGLNALYKKKK